MKALIDGITGKGLFFSEEFNRYLTLPVEKRIRIAVSLFIFKRRGWMNRLKV